MNYSMGDIAIVVFAIAAFVWACMSIFAKK